MAKSDYITEVFEYVYAPGQQSAIAKKTDISKFIGEPSVDKGCLHLGGFGGYVVAGFDHDVKNVEGADFEVFAMKGAWPQPGVVYVMSDTNKDGLPNDEWCELKGNQYKKSIRNYWVRYYRSEDDSTNVTWLDSKGSRGELVSGLGDKYTAGWWWASSRADSITFTGTRLPDAFDVDANGSWTVPAGRFAWGYAKNVFGTDYDEVLGANSFDLDNAVAADGTPVELTSIRFIKIQTSVFQRAGWMNEISTEVMGAKDLNTKVKTPTPAQ
ncbi:MAG TPA: hypothetical protein VIK29_10030 [Paludibacter sp.]